MKTAVLIFIFSLGAFADVSETTILQTNHVLDLNTGAVATSGGDLLWDGSTITPQGVAKAHSVGKLGITGYGQLGLSYFAQQAKAGNSNPIPANLLIPGNGIAVLTNGGNTAKVLVIANSDGMITLEFTTFGISAPAGVPLVDQVLNNSSYIPRGFSNSGISPSSVFVVFGSGMSDPGNPVPQASAAPGLPLSLSGTSIGVVVNGVTTHPAMYYTSPGQLAAVLPASTPIGTGLLTVTYRGNTSAPTPIQVVRSALGINTYSNNVAVATDASNFSVLSYTNSGAPGQTIVLWATGLGANPADSDTTYTTKPHSVPTPLTVYIGGIPASILYQGASGYPGVNQINLVIPKSAPTGCWVPIAAVAGGVLSNVATVSINKGGGACVDALEGLTGDEVAPPPGKTLRTGLVALIQTNTQNKKGIRTITNSTDAAFETYSGLYPTNNTVSPGGCLLTQGLHVVPFPNFKGLDSGAITLTGPSGPPITLKSQGIAGAYYSLLSADAITSAGGTYTFKGAGGKDVGPFTTTLTLANPLITWTNSTEAATVDRSKGLHFTWTGGNPGSYLFLLGTSTSDGLQNVGGFTCLAPIEDGEFTVPDYILSGMPAGTGGVQMQNAIYGTVPASGLDSSVAIADISYSVLATFK